MKTSRLSVPFFGLATVLALAATLTQSVQGATAPPNIIIIMADDLGYGDLGCYGHPTIKTPHLDRMAAEGMRFTDYYSGQNLCTPSRAALMTGRLPIRSGMAGSAKRHVLYPEDKGGLPAEEITIAEALKTKGYVTGMFGKWHIGHQPEQMPNKQGFDYYFGLPYSNDMDVDKEKRQKGSMSQDPDYTWFNVPLYRNEKIIERPVDQTTITKRYTEEAVQFIERNKKKPFFIYFPQTFPHVPLFASAAFKGKSLRGRYGDTVEELDWSVGQLLETLRRQKLDKNTLVIFTSDNGPWLGRGRNGGSAGLLRDGKAGTWEGGTRVPCLAWWPGKVPAGAVCREIANAMDLFTTSVTLAGAELPKDRPIDGVDMSPLLFGAAKGNRSVQYYYYTSELQAVRMGDFKAFFITHDGYSKAPAEPHDPPLLFNLAADPGERFNVAEQYPDVVKEITRIAEQHRAETKAGPEQF